MGLGLHGGGLESARYLAKAGALVTVTDLRDETVLSPSIAQLEGLPIRYVLGKHELADFSGADLVVKNPAVKPDSPYLAVARRIETDISLFLADCPGRLIAVTGSKGKSSTASALRWALEALGSTNPAAPGTAAATEATAALGTATTAAPGTAAAAKATAAPATAAPRVTAGDTRSLGGSGKVYLGGNITLSPLTFLDQVQAEDTVVLELSSWQLGDLRGRRLGDRALLKPRVAVMTTILPDHLDRYGTMEAYVADKRVIYQGQDRADATVSANDTWGLSFARETPGRSLLYSDSPLSPDLPGGWIVREGNDGGKTGPAVARLADGTVVEVVGSTPRLAGYHQKKNLLAAALALLDLGYPARELKQALDGFPGIEHRLEFFHERGGVRFYNDTAATIPEAAAAAIDSFDQPPILVTGGTDKALDFSPLVSAATRAKAIILLDGTGSAKLAALLDQRGIPYLGPFNNLDTAVLAAHRAASAGDPVVLSPGCASFGMFLNEFDRGKKWKEAVLRLL